MDLTSQQKEQIAANRAAALELQAEKRRQQVDERARRNKEFAARQEQARQHELLQKRLEREGRQTTMEREEKVRSFRQAAAVQSRMLFNKPQLYSPPRPGSSSASALSPNRKAASPPVASSAGTHSTDE